MTLGKTGWVLFTLGALGTDLEAQTTSSYNLPMQAPASSPYAMPKASTSSATSGSASNPSSSSPIQRMSLPSVASKPVMQSTTVTPPPPPVSEKPAAPPVLEEPGPTVTRLMHTRQRLYPQSRLSSPDDQSHLVQTRVLLAWMADPMTCRYPLNAQASGSVLEVRGVVPNHNVRNHALNVAERVSRLNVMDALHVQAQSAKPVPVVPPEQLHRAALEALARGSERYIRDLKVQTNASGQISVSGAVPSYEHKLAVSQVLRNVTGCTHVDNELTVRSFRFAGGAYMLVSADGRYIAPSGVPVPAVKPAPVATVQVRPAPVTKPAPVVKTLPPVPAPRPIPATVVQRAESSRIPANGTNKNVAAPPARTPTPMPAVVKPVQPQVAVAPKATAPARNAKPVQTTAVPTQTTPRYTVSKPTPPAAVQAVKNQSSPATKPVSSPASTSTAKTPPPATVKNEPPKTMVGAIAQALKKRREQTEFKRAFEEAQPVVISRQIITPGQPPRPVAVAQSTTTVKPVPAVTTPKPTTARLPVASAVAPAPPVRSVNTVGVPITPPTQTATASTQRKTETTRTPSTSSMKWISQQEAMALAKPASSPKKPTTPAPGNVKPATTTTVVVNAKPTPPTTVVKPVSRPPSTAYVATSKPSAPVANVPAERAYPFGNVPTTRQAASSYTPGVPVAKDQATPAAASSLVRQTPPSTYVAKDHSAPPPAPVSTYRPASAVQSAKLPSTVQVAKVEPPKNTATLYDYQPPAPRRMVTPISTYQTQTVATVSTPRPAAPPVVIFEEKPAMANHHAVTSGVVVVSTEDSPQAVPEVAAASLEDLLKQRVAMACGPAGRDLEVVLRSTTHVTVDLKAHDRATAQQLCRKVLQLPELEPYRVSLKIQVEP